MSDRKLNEIDQPQFEIKSMFQKLSREHQRKLLEQLTYIYNGNRFCVSEIKSSTKWAVEDGED
jgi:hypothetical protein